MNFGMFDDLDLDLSPGPIEPMAQDVPLRPQENWKQKTNPNRLVKTFEFFDDQQRNNFVNLLFDYEDIGQHRAQITLANDGRHVRLSIFTPEVGVITDLDKEYASTADELYDESFESYNSQNEEDIF